MDFRDFVNKSGIAKVVQLPLVVDVYSNSISDEIRVRISLFSNDAKFLVNDKAVLSSTERTNLGLDNTCRIAIVEVNESSRNSTKSTFVGFSREECLFRDFCS